MWRSRGGLAGAGRTGDSGQMHVLVQQAFRCQRKQGQLDAGGKTTGIGNVRSFSDGVPVQFREAINEMPAMLLLCPRRHLSGPALFMIALSLSEGPEVRIVEEVLAQVDDAEEVRQRTGFPVFLGVY